MKRDPKSGRVIDIIADDVMLNMAAVPRHIQSLIDEPTTQVATEGRRERRGPTEASPAVGDVK
ncbi:hypothetical protein GS504_01870 [Rhodococcus hoagii]|nr:hypothetical protein [Prescottella equi]NKS72228.1 hypothetical protein [Prescottella equi]